MNPNGNNDFQEYLYAWAAMMVNIWEEKLIMLDIRDKGELYDSFIHHVLIHSGGDQAKMEFAFNQYGFYVNAGVGKEVSKGNSGDLIDVSHYNMKRNIWELARKPKPWFDKSWYRSIYALKRDVGKIYGDKAKQGIIFHLTNNAN